MVPHVNSDTYSLVLVIPFPNGSSGLNSDTKFTTIAKKITEIGRKYFGENWLKSWPRERQPDLLTESEEIDYKILQDRKHDLSEVVKAASFELAKLETLESQLSNNKNNNNGTLVEYISSVKQQQHQLMVTLTKQIRDLDKKINEMRDNFKSRLF